MGQVIHFPQPHNKCMGPCCKERSNDKPANDDKSIKSFWQWIQDHFK